MDDLERKLKDVFELSADCSIQPDNRGMTNQIWFVGNYALTIFNNRPADEVEKICNLCLKANPEFLSSLFVPGKKLSEQDTVLKEALSKHKLRGIFLDSSTWLLPKIVMAKDGSVVTSIGGKPAILSERLSGKHFVERDHSHKEPIPDIGQQSIANNFWRLQSTLSLLGSALDIDNDLGQFDYLPLKNGNIAIEDLPPCLDKPYVREYLKLELLPAKYPSLLHHDLERQNVLHDGQGRVQGIVDIDAITGGDILLKYCRTMMNFAFTDPEYKPAYVDRYMQALIDWDMIDPEDISLMPQIIPAVVALDLINYWRYEDPLDPKTDLEKLAKIYDLSLERVAAYFKEFSLDRFEFCGNFERMSIGLQAGSEKRENYAFNF